MYNDCCYAITQNSLYTERYQHTELYKAKRTWSIRLIRTAKGVLGDKARALGSIHAPSDVMRHTLALATYTYHLDVFSLPDEVSERPSSTTNLHFFALLCL